MSKKVFKNLGVNDNNLKGVEQFFKKERTQEIAEAEQENTARNTVVFYKEDLDFLRKYVLTKKLNEDNRFSQKEALHEAIQLLRSKVI